jgi:GxxExxY protein
VEKHVKHKDTRDTKAETDKTYPSPEDTRLTKEEINELSREIIGDAIEVHRAIYEECLAHELTLRRIPFERPVTLPLKGIRLESGYRLDMVVKEGVVVEVKAIEHVLPVHQSQLLSYLRLTHRWLGLLLNFHVPVLQQGIHRIVN